LPLGRIDEAALQLRIAEKIDPLSPAVLSTLRYALRVAGRFDEAEAVCYKMPVDVQQKTGCLAEDLLRRGENDKAIRILEARWSGHLLELWIAWFRWVRFGWEGRFSYLRDLRCCAAIRGWRRCAGRSGCRNSRFGIGNCDTHNRALSGRFARCPQAKVNLCPQDL
jgi:hypothetical protein